MKAAFGGIIRHGFAVAIFTITTGITATLAADARSGGGGDDFAVIRRDSNGIVHIAAPNEEAMAFAQGYVHARDRLFQMDLLRRTANGTLAELLGPDAVADDVELRTLGLRRAAEQTIGQLDSAVQGVLAAYASGVNAYKAVNPLPPEYGALKLATIDDWSALDSVAVGKLLAFELSADLDDMDRQEALTEYQDALNSGPVSDPNDDKGWLLFSEDTWRFAPFSAVATAAGDGAATTGPQPPPGVGRFAAKGADLHTLIGTWKQRLDRAPRYRQLVRKRDHGAASNAFVVSGRLTKGRRPLLANDPHLDLTVPTLFYLIHLRTWQDGFDVNGASVPGLPYIIQGMTPQFAWGVTSSGVDVTDIYLEQLVPDPASPSGLSTLFEGQPEFVIPIPQTFRANVDGQLVGIPVPPEQGGVTLIVPRRNGGPIVAVQDSTAMSLQWTGFAPTFDIEGFRELCRAKTRTDFEAALQKLDAVTQNILYADRTGTIAYYLAGEIPLREDLQAETVDPRHAPYLIRDGQGGQEWLPASNPPPHQALPYAILPPEEMPRAIDPEAGYLINANNDPLGDTFDNDPLNQFRPGGGIRYLGADFNMGIRAQRIEQLLEPLAASREVTFATLQAIQADVVMYDASVFIGPQILRAFDAVNEHSHPRLKALAGDPGVAEAVARLRVWDFSAPTGVAEGYDAADEGGEVSPVVGGQEAEASIAATIYSLWRSSIIANTIDHTLQEKGLPEPSSRYAIRALRHVLDTFDDNHGIGASGEDFFMVPGVADADAPTRRDIIILQSLKDALDGLASDQFALAFGNSTNQDDYRWGLLHRLTIDHPLGGPFSFTSSEGLFPPPFVGLPGLPVDGGFETVDRSSHNVRAGLKDRDDPVNDFVFAEGPLDRFVVRLGAGGNQAWNALPGGVSGVLGSEFYANLLGPWLTNDAFRFGPCRGDCGPLEVLATGEATLGIGGGAP